MRRILAAAVLCMSACALWAVSADDGKKLAEYKLSGLPAWDALIAAGGRLYLTMQDGTVSCFSSKQTTRFCGLFGFLLLRSEKWYNPDVVL